MESTETMQDGERDNTSSEDTDYLSDRYLGAAAVPAATTATATATTATTTKPSEPGSWRINGMVFKRDIKASTGDRNNGRPISVQRDHRLYNSNASGSGSGSGADKANLMTPLAQLMYSDDMRISKIIRRLIGENNVSVAVDLCNKLETAVRTPSNAAYICRSFDMLLDNMIIMLQRCPPECAGQASVVFGLMGYINRSEFTVFKEALFDAYKYAKKIRKWLMMALRTTLSCDAVNLDLKHHSEDVLVRLKDYLENAEKVDEFIVISETIAEFSKHYNLAFGIHFKDIVDIVIGWHLEGDQTQMLKHHCSQVLQQFSSYFLIELNFTLGLLGQFLEDIVAFGEDVGGSQEIKKHKEKPEIRIGAFVGAFNSILKAMSTKTKFLAFSVGHDVVRDALTVIIKAASATLHAGLATEETVLNVNDFLCLIFEYDFDEVNLQQIEEFIELQIQSMGEFNEVERLSLLYLLLAIVRQMRSRLTPTVMNFIVRSEDNPLQTLKLSANERVYRIWLRIHQEVLLIKNVPLLQEAYKHIKADVEQCMAVLETQIAMGDVNASRAVKASTVLSFQFSVLSALATQTSSIIGMYALNPSILELLISDCNAAKMSLWSHHSALHHALLHLLAVHCQKNHNFCSSSRLLKDQNSDENVSPSSENFAIILKFLAEILRQHRDLQEESLRVLLEWSKNLLFGCAESSAILESHGDFVSICQSLSMTATRMPLPAADCLLVLLNYASINSDVLLRIRDVAVHMLDSLDPRVRQVFASVYAKVPLGVSLSTAKAATANEIQQEIRQRGELQQWYQSTPFYAPLRAVYFKDFLERLQPFSNGDDKSATALNLLPAVQIAFAKSWIAQMRDRAVEYRQRGESSPRLLIAWMQVEAARYCVRNKLRTTIGKPQETFLAIEAIIMKYARIAACKEPFTIEQTSNDNLLQQLSSARSLLGFLEQLEKHIYNASEGTAFAIVPAEKPAKTFFRINTHTCNEWFKRIRNGVNLMALQCMEPEMVVRNSEVPLASEKPSDAITDHTLSSLVAALLALGETDSLSGLYVWLKSRTGKRYAWIQSAAEQAAGHKEQAAIGYSNYLSEHDSKIPSSVKEFVIDQLLDCLYYTGQWSKMREMSRQFQLHPAENLNLCNLRSEEELQAMERLYYGVECSALDESGRDKLMTLMEWSLGDEDTPESEQRFINYSYTRVLRKLENSCIAQILSNDSKDMSSLQHAIQRGLEESLRHGSGSGCDRNLCSPASDFIILNRVVRSLSDEDSTFVGICLDNEALQSSTVLTKCHMWSLLFEARGQSAIVPSNGQKHNIYLDIATSARREGNNSYSRSMLQRFFALKGLPQSLPQIVESVQNSSHVINVGDEELLRGFSELAKCMYVSSTQQQQQQEAINFSAAYCHQIVRQVSHLSYVNYPEASASMLLTMADWLSQRGPPANGSNGGGNSCGGAASAVASTQLQALLASLPNPALTDDAFDSVIPSSEKAVGHLLNASIQQKPDFAAAWCSYGNWCYRWGKKLVEARNTSNPGQKGNLNQRDLQTIKELLGVVGSDEVIDQLLTVLDNHQLSIYEGVEDIETNDSNSTEQIEQELKKIEALAGQPDEVITSIVSTWRQAHKSVYAYYEMATRAYFKYLAIETMEGEPKHQQQQEQKTGNSTFVTTTLRLLRLVVKHAIGLQDVLEEGLRNTPLRPWKVIIPQLFSRLNHHEPYVRKSVSELLCRLAQDRPHLIIFPAVVGAQQELKNHSPGAVGAGGDEKDDKDNNKSPNTTLSTCFGSLLQTLSEQSPETVVHVQMLVKELKRVTLLWEEYWTHALTQLYGEYSTLFNNFEMEAKKYNGNSTHYEKINAKYEIIMRHVIGDLQRIAAVTSKPAETNYERNFQERYNQFIEQTIDELRKPLNLSKPSEGWLRIKQLYGVFQQRAMRGSATTLKISDLSPALANMRDTGISMPGVDTFEKHPIYIRAVESSVHILPTKTKPKKLAFIGSDGRKYTYLFKGLEDLHLDERIMQFLSISNSMMARSQEAICNSISFRAQHYSVIPLGPQSGLISWVDEVTPLFAIYKKWQQRDAAIKQQQKEKPQSTHHHQQQQQQQQQQQGHQNTNTNQQQQQSPMLPAATRPSELFYAKLTPLLAEQNIKVTDARKTWPLATLRQVLEELTKETPRDLLAKELWCYATNATMWRKSIRNYSISMAVMSVIGYVIGLGDRHLDNVLINLSSGEILHIDYNVCFEKGKTLRVPEKVPFRLTPNLEEALGITGVEGAFRLGCEHVLRILRKERETLLTLLEAFVYDPLVDWTVNDDGTPTTTRTTTAHAAASAIAAMHHGHHGPSSAGGGGTSSSLSTTATVSVAGLLRDVKGINSKAEDYGTKRQDWDLLRQAIGGRFNEIKPFWLKYKDEVIQRLKRISGEIAEIVATRHTIAEKETERDTLSKQLAMIRDMEALGSARGSHALNTISQRYATFKREVESFAAAKRSVQRHRDDVEAVVDGYYRVFLPLTTRTTTPGDLASLHMELCEQQEIAYDNEFDAVRDILIAGGHERLHAEGDFARREMDNTLYQERRCAATCLDMMLQYVNVMRYYPRSLLLKNRLPKYAEWYGRLLEDDAFDAASLQSELEHCMQVDSAEAGDGQQQQAALLYSQALEKLWIECNFDLHKASNSVNELKQLAIPSIEDAIEAVHHFSAMNPSVHAPAISFHMSQTLAKTNDSFLLFEESALRNADLFMLDQQIDYIEILLALCQHAYGDADASVYAGLEMLGITLRALHRLRAAFDLALLERIVQLFMLDDHPKLQQYLRIMCTTPYTSLDETCPDAELLRGLLAEIYDYFDDFEQGLDKLQEMARQTVEQMADCSYKQSVFSKIVSNNFYLITGNMKYETIANVFFALQEQVQALKTNDSSLVYDVRQVAAPISAYVMHVEQSYLCGLTSLFAHSLRLSLDFIYDLGQHPIDDHNHNDNAATSTAQGLSQNLFIALQHNCRVRNQEAQLEQCSKWVEHYTLVTSAHYWANERLLRDLHLMYGHIVYKDKLLAAVEGASKSLAVWQPTIVKIQADLDDVTAAIAEILRERNHKDKDDDDDDHNIVEQQQSYEECVNAQLRRYQFFLRLGSQLIGFANILMQFEMVQSGNTFDTDNTFLATVCQWQESFARKRQSAAVISPVEQAIVQLLDPEDNVDQCWIENIAGLLDDMTYGVQRQLAELERRDLELQDSLFAQGQQIQALFDSSMRMDIRHLLKMISKNDKQQPRGFYALGQPSVQSAASLEAPVVRKLQHMLKLFYTQLGELQTQLLQRDCSSKTLPQLEQRLDDLEKAMEHLNRELLELVTRFSSGGQEARVSQISGSPAKSGIASPSTAAAVAVAMAIDNPSASGAGTSTGGQGGGGKGANIAAGNDGNSGGGGGPVSDKKPSPYQQQKRNAYAVSVWKRVRMKLEGRDPDGNRRSSVAEQVDFIVREAMNPDNLAVLYEGWTPWV